MHQNPAFHFKGNMYDSSKHEKFTDFDLPVTDKISKLQVSVPIYPGLNREEVIDILQKHWSNGNGSSSSVL